MKGYNTTHWVRWSVFNFMVVALLGVLMRYKIGFEFPLFNQKNIQHAHAHFAFAGWVSQSLMVLMLQYYKVHQHTFNHTLYNRLLVTQLISSWGMLITFFIQGYGPYSIACSALSLLTSFVFVYAYLKDLKQLPYLPANKWFKAALWFNVLSSAGTFMLMYMMITRHITQHVYLGSVYFYLHFQYNGWFFFCIAGLFTDKLFRLHIPFTNEKRVFQLFAAACIPAYLLSVLWAKLPLCVYPFIIGASVAQLVAWWLLIKNIVQQQKLIRTFISPLTRYLFLFIGVAVTIKLLLQAGSNLPALSKLAFGFRPIVMAYLHLILLGVVSMFIVTYYYSTHMLRKNKWSIAALVLLSAGVLLNEVILGAQGVAGIAYIMLPYTNEILFFVACLIACSLLMLLISQWRKVS